MSQATVERLEHILRAAAADFDGVEVVKTGVRRERHGYALALTVDREGGVDTSLCERITRALVKRLDAQSPPLGAYSIEVGSAGLDRPLLTPEHFQRFAGREARIITHLRIGNRVEFTGTVRNADDVKVTFADRYAGEVQIPYAAIKKANLVYEPAADLKRDKRGARLGGPERSSGHARRD